MREASDRRDNGINSRIPRTSGIDFYRHAPKDLTEATSLGAFMSICCIVIMILLFISETLAFVNTKLVGTIAVDDPETSSSLKIRINFDISFHALPCEFLSLSVLDSLGANRQNMTKNMKRWRLDSSGKEVYHHGDNLDKKNQKKKIWKNTENQNKHKYYPDEPGIHPKSLTEDTFEDFLEENPLVFMNFYSPDCEWCKQLHPTWDEFARKVEEEKIDVKIAMMDCDENSYECNINKVRGFPSLWFYENEQVMNYYHGDRTVDAFMKFIKAKVKSFDRDKRDPKLYERRERFANRDRGDGCRVVGHLFVNRVPGNFHIEARSADETHTINIAQANLTHVVNHLSFGEVADPDSDKKYKRILKQVPMNYKNFSPMDEYVFRLPVHHKSYHHSLKVISTHFKLGAGSELESYQFLFNTGLISYSDSNVPSVMFNYDISPMRVVLTKQGRKWYDYLTSICAIIGGTFTTLGLLDATLYKVFKSKTL